MVSLPLRPTTPKAQRSRRFLNASTQLSMTSWPHQVIELAIGITIEQMSSIRRSPADGPHQRSTAARSLPSIPGLRTPQSRTNGCWQPGRAVKLSGLREHEERLSLRLLKHPRASHTACFPCRATLLGPVPEPGRSAEDLANHTYKERNP